MCWCAAPQFRTVLVVDMSAYREVVKGMALHLASLQAVPIPGAGTPTAPSSSKPTAGGSGAGTSNGKGKGKGKSR